VEKFSTNTLIKMNIKLALLLLLATGLSGSLLAQDDFEDDRKGKFKKENLFTGGSMNIQFGNRLTALGASPHFGYSINKFLDVAVTVGYNYISQRDNLRAGDKLRQTVLGPGAFVRLFPVNFLFAQAQYEHNFLQLKYIPPPNSGQPRENYNEQVSSLLVGAGYAGGRAPGSNSYYYFSVMWDVAKNQNSPYKDEFNRATPIIRAGFNIALFQGRFNGR